MFNYSNVKVSSSKKSLKIKNKEASKLKNGGSKLLGKKKKRESYVIIDDERHKSKLKSTKLKHEIKKEKKTKKIAYLPPNHAKLYKQKQTEYSNGYGKKKFVNESITINKNEFLDLMKNNKEEYMQIGIDIDTNEALEKIKNDNVQSLNSDFTTLCIDLFSLTKFENSRTYKMIDYIMNSDNNFLKSETDKENFEEIKKTVFNMSNNDHKENIYSIYKSLYQYFKTDFSQSKILKIFDKTNQITQEIFKPKQQTTTNTNLFTFNNQYPDINYFVDKKDKFTYQNYLSDKIKYYLNNNDYITEIYDPEIMKSLIYLNNKNNKNQGKINVNTNTKTDNNQFMNLVKDNVTYIENEHNNLFQCQNILENETFTKIKSKVKEYKSLLKYNKKKLAKLFYSKSGFEVPKELNKKRVYVKMLEFFTKFKEDDYDKILKKLKKSEFKDKELTEGISDVKSFWVKFKFLFYLNNLGQQDGTNTNKILITDDSFWRQITKYFTNPANIYTINNNSGVKQGQKKRKR